MNNVVWTKDMDTYLIANYGKHHRSNKQIADNLGLHKGSVVYRADKLGLAKRRHKLLEKADFRYFRTINSNCKAYLLGLIVADGCVTRTQKERGTLIRVNKFSLSQAEKDKELVYMLRDKISPATPVNTLNLKPPRQKVFQFTIASDKLLNDLEKHGVVQNKTFLTSWPTTINKKFYKAFLLGYFDGDGSYFWTNPKIDKPRRGWSVIGTKAFIFMVRKLIYEETRILLGVSEVKCKGGYMYNLRTSGKNAESVNKWLHKGTRLGLKRKR